MNKAYYYWLGTVEGVGPVKIRDILKYFGSVENAWYGNLKDFMHVEGINQGLAERILSRKDINILQQEMGRLIEKGIDILTMDDEEYPENLKRIYDPPFIIYKKGSIKPCIRNIAVVGSRKCTSYGKTVARSLSKLLAGMGIGIISGMARGIDTEAHIGALEANGFTCAVLGCGCDIIYPPENKKLMEYIGETGAVISEYPLGTRPIPGNFPARNRIISGLSDGVLVVEAGEKSGSLITANLALEDGKDIFAVPGSILSYSSKGTNLLIRDGAKIVTDINDILSEIGIEYVGNDKSESMAGFSDKERALIDIIKDSPIYIDELVKKAALKVNDVNSVLTSLEIKGVVRILPGKYIVRIF